MALKNGDISYYINYRDERGKSVKVQVGKKSVVSDFTVKDAYSTEYLLLQTFDNTPIILILTIISM